MKFSIGDIVRQTEFTTDAAAPNRSRKRRRRQAPSLHFSELKCRYASSAVFTSTKSLRILFVRIKLSEPVKSLIQANTRDTMETGGLV